MLRSVALRGAQLVASPANWPYADSPDVRPPEVSKAMAGAAINRLVVLVADRVGTERGVSWVGGSVICDADGFRLAGPDFGVPTVLVADVDLERALDKQISPRNHMWRRSVPRPNGGRDTGPRPSSRRNRSALLPGRVRELAQALLDAALVLRLLELAACHLDHLADDGGLDEASNEVHDILLTGRAHRSGSWRRH